MNLLQFLKSQVSIKKKNSRKKNVLKGDGPTTTVSTTSTTTITVPTTEEGASTYITVDVSGKTLSEYNDEAVVDKFKQCVVILATNYCKNQDIPLTKKIT